MKRLLLFVALVVITASGCPKSSPGDGPYSGGGNPTPEGAAQAVRKSVQNVVTAAELHDLHLFLSNAKLANGRVPNSQETWDALSRPDGNRQLVKLIQDGILVLVPNPPEEGLWAYSKEVPTHGGWALTHSGPQQMTAADFAALQRAGN
jgi:hypothetical protein